MTKLYICKICGDPYIGAEPPQNCPFCGAHQGFIVESKDYKETFDVELTEKDKKYVEHALEVEISNAAFYFCAAKNISSEEGKKLFKALGKVEQEHASIWKKVLKLNKISEGNDSCSEDYQEDLKESHERETKAIQFYAEATKNADNQRIRQIFGALVQVETDHLELSEKRIIKR